MPDTTPILQLPYILPSQAQKHVTHNEAIRVLDVLVQLAVIARTVSAPPASPTQGDRYIVAIGASGAWAGRVGQIALFENGAWQFFVPSEGWTAWVTSEQVLASYDGVAWVSQADAPFTVAELGISATADANNRLSLSSPATLLNHAGAGHQVKVNKATAGDTASLLFQTGFSGRAEMGTAGGDDFAIKVSPDGAAFVTGLSIAAASGAVTLPAALRLGGQPSDPVSPPNGTVWLNTTTGEVKMRSAGASVIIATGGVGLTDGDKGDITVSAVGTVWNVDAGAISNSKLAAVASGTFKARLSPGIGAPEDITPAETATLLPEFTSAQKGLAPASGGGAINFLRADGLWAAPPSSGNLAGLGIIATAGQINRTAARPAPPPGWLTIGDPNWNLARGSQDMSDATAWVAGATVSGVVYTKIASGIGADGLPFADYTVLGTVTALHTVILHTASLSRAPAAAGQTWTVSLLAQIIAGDVPANSLTGIRLDVRGLNATAVVQESFFINPMRPTTQTLLTNTAVLANANTTQAQCEVVLRAEIGQTLNYTIRIKALQFERSPTRTDGRFAEVSPTEARSLLNFGGLGAAATLAAGGIDLTGIPAHANSVILSIWGMTRSGNIAPLIQLGAGTVETTGYLGASSLISGATPSTSTSSVGFIIPSVLGTSAVSGTVMLTRAAGNRWIASGTCSATTTAVQAMTISGDKLLAGVLDRVRITPNGTTFTAGQISVKWSAL